MVDGVGGVEDVSGGEGRSLSLMFSLFWVQKEDAWKLLETKSLNCLILRL